MADWVSQRRGKSLRPTSITTLVADQVGLRLTTDETGAYPNHHFDG